MARFHKLKVKEIIRETPDAVSVVLDVPAPIQPEFLFKMGQYITFKLNIDGQEVRRSYSLCTAPHERVLKVAVKEVPGGKMSVFINRELKVGDEVEVMTPMGKFNTPLSGSNKKKYVLFAGGSGITPMMSIIKSVLFVEKQSTIHLFYANRNEASVIFKNELEQLNKNNPEKLKITYLYDDLPSGFDGALKGPVTEEKAMQLIQNYQASGADEFFICGPGPMMENIKNALKKNNVADDKIHIEYFSSVVNEIEAKHGVGNDVEVESEVTVILYGVETTFKLKTSGINILEAAIEAGVDAPFSCKGAVCCTCRAKVLEGKVKMDANFALTDAEVEQGYALTCQAHPLTEKVVLDYDAP
ncbi:MAG: FAD-binding oxidoreductase [Bacteroidia bacterium]|nr:FAD-binding oxidoreductase [Bacteroidia bacterium]